MKHSFHYALFAIIIFLLKPDFSNAVTVNINSGNPRFPFPQFLEYASDSHSLGNLGTKNAEGVVHVELEQDIRDAYQIFANGFQYTGDSYGGVQYIKGNIGCPYDCTEGVGYALLAAAYMGDKVTFDGLWMHAHDIFRGRTKRYKDCTDNQSDYGYGVYPLAEPGGNSAADGDVDVALALYVAWMQWGDLMGINDACGNPISYKQEMIEVVRGLVAYSTRFPTENPRRANSGIIGFDGYMKGGDTWNEQTNWANTNPFTRDGATIVPEFGGPRDQHIDYNAPAYFRQFREMLNSLAPDSWEEEQFRRGEASSDWLMGKMIDASAATIPIAGWVSVTGGSANTPTYSNFSDGEDFRAPWRTILNYVWNGNPTYSWDPVGHKVVNGGNSYELNVATRFAKFLNDPQTSPWENECKKFGGGPKITYKGPLTLSYYYTPEGKEQSTFNLNWLQGTGVFTAIAVQDFDLMGLMYRQCTIEWEPAGGSDNYLGSEPRYFHGWFRLLGMLAASGNYHAPGAMLPDANMKIYRAIQDSITFAFTGDQLTYLLDYRNYGSIDAQNVKIVEKVPDDFVFVSATDGGQYNAGTHTVTWNLGTVPGFKSGALNATIGQVSYTVRVGDAASGRYCTTADITCSNGKGWTTNEYPNYKTPTMQRNCVDIVARALQIEKTVDRRLVNDGNMATFTVSFENSAEAGWIDGGRPRVNVAYAHSGLSNPAAGSQHWMKIRLYSDAIEPYINYGNYRVSYYLHDAGLNCYAGDGGCGAGWGMYNAIYEGGQKTDVKVSHENIVEGSDARGKWNQRLIVQFAPLLVTTTAHLSNYYGMGIRIHKGGTEPLRAAWYMYPSDWTTVNYGDDWSWDATAKDDDDGLYYPVSPSWQDINKPGTPVTSWLPCACESASKVVENILVEEYDGYVWRRILGTGPMPGRDISNVVIKDTLPKGLKFEAFMNTCPLEESGATWTTSQTSDGRDIITWKIPKLQVKQKGKIIYSATASFPSGAVCETPDETIINEAWIWGDKESAISDTTQITVTCAKVPEPIIPTTLIKTADKDTYESGDPVTYTIEYEQTHGSIVQNAMTMASDWQLDKWSLSGGSLTSNSTQTGTALFDYAYGTNGYMEFSCNPATYAAYQVLLRQGSGSTIALVVKPLTTSQMELSCYVNNVAVQTAQNITYGGGNPFTMRVDLFDDLLRIWINKDTTNSPIFSVTGLPVGVGYAGFKNGNITGGDSHGTHSFSNLYTHFDYAYNLSIIDRKPEEVSFVSADNGGTLIGDSIVWNLVSGKANRIPFGKKYTVTWTGTVDECNESIINIAYAKLMGHADNEIMAQVVSECGVSACNLDSVQLRIAAPLICEGDSTLLRAVPYPSGNYLYEFFLDGVSINTASTTDSIYVKEEGKYTVIAYDKNDLTCKVKNKTPQILTVEKKPEIDLGEDKSLCEGDVMTLDAGPEGTIYDWNTGETTRTIDVSADGIYSVIVKTAVCTVKDTIQVTFGKVSLAGDGFTLNGKPILNRKDSICPNTVAEIATTYITDSGTEYVWESVPEDQNMVANGAKITISPEQTTTYYVRLTQECEAVDSVTISIATPMELTVTPEVSCGSIELQASVSPDIPTVVYTWQIEGETNTTTGQTLTIDNFQSDNGVVFVTATSPDACPSEQKEIPFFIPDLSISLDGASFVCNGKTTDLVVTPVSNEINPSFIYSWYIDDVLQSNTTDTQTGGKGSYKVVVKTEFCEKEVEHEVTEGEEVVILPGDGFELNGKAILNRKDSICPNMVAEIVVTYITDAGTEYVWESIPEDQSMVADGAKITISPEQTTTYYVRLTQECDAMDSVTISIASPMEFAVTTDVSCKSIELQANAESNIAVTYTWQIKGESDKTTGATFVIDNTLADKGDVIVTATSTEACPSEPKEIPFLVPGLSISLTGSPSVCPGETTNLTVTPVSNEENPVFTYAWYIDNVLQSNTTDTQTGGKGSYKAVVKTDYCEEEIEHEITEGSGELTGTLSVNGNDQLGKEKTYGSCGEMLTIEANYITTGTNGFKWSSNPADASLTSNNSNTITVQPTVDTEYYLEFENKCTAYDTIRIKMKPQATLSVTIDNSECGKAIFNASSEPEAPVYTWTVNGTIVNHTGSQLIVSNEDGITGVVETYVESDDYCQSEITVSNYEIDTIGKIEITAETIICPNTEASLSATVEVPNGKQISYQWASRKAGSNDPFVPLAGATNADYTSAPQQEDTEYQLSVTSGSCIHNETISVLTDQSKRTGTITADGVTPVLENGVKTYKTCGLLPTALSATHVNTDENKFVWKSIPQDLNMSAATGKDITVQPDVKTLYIVEFENNCPLSDTILVEVYPFSVSADWGDFANALCEGSAITATLNLTGYDASMTGSYIRWYKDGVELTENANQTSLTINETALSHEGEYTYKVSNGLCELPASPTVDKQSLKVNPYTKFTPEKSEYIVIRGEEVEMQLNDVDPASATIRWENQGTILTGNPAVLNSVEKDQTWEVEVSATGYCPTTAEINVKVDAKLSLSMLGEKDKICMGETVRLTADTTGTGRLLTPAAYQLVWEERTESGSYNPVSTNGITVAVTPSQTKIYRVKATYNTQEIYSNEFTIEVFNPATYDVVQDIKVCEGDKAEISINNLQPADAIVQWNPDATITSGDLSSPVITVAPNYVTGGKKYSFTISQIGRCEQTDMVNVLVEQPVSYNPLDDAAVCEGESVTLSVNAASTSTIRYEWHEAGEAEIISTNHSLKVTPAVTTVYEVTMKPEVCPAVIASTEVVVNSSPKISNIEHVKLRDVEIHLDPNYGQGPFLYKEHNGEFGVSSIITISRYGLTTYIVQDANGCEDSQKFEVEAPKINPPLSFTPDGDGDHDTWGITDLSEAYPSAVISIYDRFGKKLVEMSSSEVWDGTYLGRAMPTTDYWYEINVEELDKIYIGHFTLIRN